MITPSENIENVSPNVEVSGSEAVRLTDGLGVSLSLEDRVAALEKEVESQKLTNYCLRFTIEVLGTMVPREEFLRARQLRLDAEAADQAVETYRKGDVLRQSLQDRGVDIQPLGQSPV